MSDISDDVAAAQFAAQVTGELTKVDKNTIDGSRSNPAAKLDPYAFLKGRGNNQQRVVVPQKVVVDPNTDPNLAPLPLDQILIPMPNDLKKKAISEPDITPVSAAKSTQLELPLVISTDSNIPQSPKEMFNYFKERFDMLDSKLTGVISLIKEIKTNGVPRKIKYKETGPL